MFEFKKTDEAKMAIGNIKKTNPVFNIKSDAV